MAEFLSTGLAVPDFYNLASVFSVCPLFMKEKI
jgi:hypothetical protein